MYVMCSGSVKYRTFTSNIGNSYAKYRKHRSGMYGFIMHSSCATVMLIHQHGNEIISVVILPIVVG